MHNPSGSRWLLHSRNAQPQTTAGGYYPAYDSSGYGVSGYGYGAASYGDGSYGAAVAGYGGTSGVYRNPNAQVAGYVNGPPGGPSILGATVMMQILAIELFQLGMLLQVTGEVLLPLLVNPNVLL